MGKNNIMRLVEVNQKIKQNDEQKDATKLVELREMKKEESGDNSLWVNQ